MKTIKILAVIGIMLFAFQNLSFAQGEKSKWQWANRSSTIKPTLTEINYLQGVTDTIQEQLNKRYTAAQADTLFPKIADGQAAYIKECLYANGTKISNTGSTTENTVLTFTIPGGKMGPNGYLDIDVFFSHTSNTNYKSFNVYINGTKVAFGSSNGLAGAGSRHRFRVSNRNSVSSQVFANPGYIAGGQYSGNLSASATPSTGSFNSDNTMTVTVSLQCTTSAADVANIEGISVESVYQPAL